MCGSSPRGHRRTPLALGVRISQIRRIALDQLCAA
jgi:hypothetical protein